MDANWKEFNETMPEFSSRVIKKLSEVEETVKDLSSTMLSIDSSKFDNEERERFLQGLYKIGKLEAELEFLTNGMKE